MGRNNLKAPQRGKVRIVGGSWRGTRLQVPQTGGVRPTTDRTRETLFNWLAPVIAGARCLDLFAGSGALGFEAASRGAGEVTMIDHSASVIATLTAKRNGLNATQIEIIQADALAWVRCNRRRFDIVFIDPPFARDMVPQVCMLLIEHAALAEGALLYCELERAAMQPAIPAPLHIVREKASGSVHYGLIKYHTVNRANKLDLGGST